MVRDSGETGLSFLVSRNEKNLSSLLEQLGVLRLQPREHCGL